MGLDELEQRVRRRRTLQRLFSTFPGGRPGVGLLLLRVAVGLAGVAQGVIFLSDTSGVVLENWIVGMALTGSGALLLVGFLTPLAGVLVSLTVVAIGISWFPPARTNLFHEPLPTVVVVIVAAAIALIGPGAFSLDSRLFGRREIIIPRMPHSGEV